MVVLDLGEGSEGGTIGSTLTNFLIVRSHIIVVEGNITGLYNFIILPDHPDLNLLATGEHML